MNMGGLQDSPPAIARYYDFNLVTASDTAEQNIMQTHSTERWSSVLALVLKRVKRHILSDSALPSAVEGFPNIGPSAEARLAATREAKYGPSHAKPRENTTRVRGCTTRSGKTALTQTARRVGCLLRFSAWRGLGG